MNLFQFLRIIWAHRFLTLGITLGSLIGAFIVLLIVPPSYSASSRVMLNTLKADPITGEVVGNNSSRTYVATQTELIRDFGVATKAVEKLGFASDPNRDAQFQASGDKSGGGLERWLAQKIIDGTDVSIVPMTNILEIKYRAPSARDAKIVADALRDAYIDTVLETRRQQANRDADWYEQQAGKVEALLTKANDAKTAYERETGIVMQGDNYDVDSARLRALSGQGVVGAVVPMTSPTMSPAAMQLTQIDAGIAQASQTLGPNHPQMIEMKARRALVANLAAQERSQQQNSSQSMAAASAANAGAIERQVALQTSRVIEKRDKIQKLEQLQSELKVRQDQYAKILERVARLRQEAAVADTGISVLGIASLPQKPIFPNKPLIMGGALGLGLAMGITISLLVELLGRRIRSAEDMRSYFEVPLLTVVKMPTSVVETGRKARRGSVGWFSRRLAVGT